MRSDPFRYRASRARPRQSPRPQQTARRAWWAVVVAVALAGCDIPTELPEFETRWIVPAEETRFGVGQLLPGAVSLTPDGSAFLVDFDPVQFLETLGALCPACIAADGLTVPKPAFVGTFASAVDFPPEVSSVDVLDGQVAVELLNGFAFDPLRPAAGVFGSIAIDILDDADGDILGTVVVDGEDQAFPPNTTLMLVIDLVATSVDGSVEAEVSVDSPTGDPVEIDASEQVGVTVDAGNVRVASVEIDVASRSVAFDPVGLDVEGVETDLTDRIVSGAFIVDVVNPFAISAQLDVEVSGPTIATIQKSATIGAEPESTVRVDFSAAELRSFLGQPDVELSGAAVVDPNAASVTVLPGQELVLSAALDVTLRIGGEG